MDKDALAERLLATFVEELYDHAGGMSRDLLALERAGEASERVTLFQALFRRAHALKGAARAVNARPIELACHRAEEILAALRDGARQLDAPVVELLLALSDALGEAGELLRERRDLGRSRLIGLLPRLDAASAKRSAPPAPAVVDAAAAPPRAPPPEPPAAEGWVRVRAEKLDSLLAKSGELLVARRRLAEHREQLQGIEDELRAWEAERRAADRPLRRLIAEHGAKMPRRTRETLLRSVTQITRFARELERARTGFARDQQTMERISARVEEEVRRVRMLPFESACLGLERAVRDMAKAGGKDAELEVRGGAVELDRTVLDALKDGLLQLVRNAVVHGLETPGERRAAGKPERGRVTVSAEVRSSTVVVSVLDDGRGVDVVSLKSRARARGLALPETEREAARLVFAPGVSTASIVTELSGRGVGLDVVKASVEELHGTIDVDFEPGRWTRFTLAVPLTLTTMRTLTVRSGGQMFALPASSVMSMVRVKPEQIRSAGGREVYAHDGALLPVSGLAATLGITTRPPAPAARIVLVLLSAGTMRAAFAVDEVVAEQEIVMKPLGPWLVGASLFAGATILPEGRVVLIVSPADLLRAASADAAPRPVLPEVAVTPAARKRLLIADDSLTTRTLQKTLLEAAGYQVTAAADGMEAWQILEAQGADLLVADVEMPRMDGLALTAAVRASKRHASLPIILITALDSDEHKRRGLEAGADAYLVKSAFDQDSLLELVSELA